MPIDDRSSPPPPDLLSGSVSQIDYAAFQDESQGHANESPSETPSERRTSLQRTNSLDAISVHLTDSTRPTSLREFFHDFGRELKSLVVELIDYGKNKTWKKKLMTAFLMISSALVFYDLIFGRRIISLLEGFIHWMTAHPSYAVIAFVSLFVVCTCECCQ